IGRPPNRVCHSSWLITQTDGPFGRSSLAEKLRPRAGRTPSVGKNVTLTRRLFNCSGSPLPVSVKLSNAEMPTDESERASSRISSYRGHETAGALKFSCGLLVQIATSDEAFGIVTGFSTSRSYTEKSDVLAPMPTAIVRMTTVENPGLLRRARTACLKSDM